MRWAGHLVRMEDTRLPKQLFYGELVNGKRPRWKPRKRFKDCLKFNLKELSIDDEVWEETALNRGDWRKAVKDGCKSLEYNRIEHAKLKRELRKGCADNVPPDSMRWTCETCERVLLSKAGYVNHLKAHQNTPIHKHTKNGCLFKILEGNVSENFYKNNNFIKYNNYKEGDIKYIDNFIGMHSMNNDSGKICVSLHIYAF